jgi:ketosteroid isomerase-like protein
MIDHQSVSRWLQEYVTAWETYDPQAIANLFSEHATYRYNPYDAEPVTGRDAIVANWLEYRDAPNTYKAEYHPIAVDGNTAVANGRSVYFEPDGKTLKRQYDNIFVLRFDDQGRCAEFTEWFMQPR